MKILDKDQFFQILFLNISSNKLKNYKNDNWIRKI